MIKESLSNGIFLANMEKVYQYYEIASSEDLTECALILCQIITATKLRALSYGVAVIKIVSKEKAMQDTYYSLEARDAFCPT